MNTIAVILPPPLSRHPQDVATLVTKRVGKIGKDVPQDFALAPLLNTATHRFEVGIALRLRVSIAHPYSKSG